MSMLNARSPRYPALYDHVAGVVFAKGRAEITEEQALLLAERRHIDGILLVDLDEEGHVVGAQHVKEWARDRRREGDSEGDSEKAPPALPDAPEIPAPAEGQEQTTRKTR